MRGAGDRSRKRRQWASRQSKMSRSRPRKCDKSAHPPGPSHSWRFVDPTSRVSIGTGTGPPIGMHAEIHAVACIRLDPAGRTAAAADAARGDDPLASHSLDVQDFEADHRWQNVSGVHRACEIAAQSSTAKLHREPGRTDLRRNIATGWRAMRGSVDFSFHSQKLTL